MYAIRRAPCPRCPTNLATTRPTTPLTPPRGHYPRAFAGYLPNLGQIRCHRLPRIPLRIVELCGGLATGLEALLRSSSPISSYAWADTNTDAHTAASHRVAYLRREFPHLLPQEVIYDWHSRLSMDVRTISPELLSVQFPEGIDLILAIPPMIATHLSNSNKEHIPPVPNISRHITRIVLHISELQPRGVWYI